MTVTVLSPQAPPLTASTTRITAREFSAVPRRTAEDALRLVPGLTLAQHGSEGKGHQFFLRGFDALHGTDLEATVEGIPINEWSNVHAQGYIDLGFVIPETIASVEVTKGPFTLGQGAFAMAGSADYRLGVAEADRGLCGSYTLGTTNRHRGLVTYSPRAGDGEEFIAVEALHDDGFGMNREIDRATLLGRVRLIESAQQGTLSLLGSGYLARFALPGTLRDEDVRAGRVGFYDAYDRAGRGRSARGLLALSHEWLQGRQQLRSTLYAGYRELELLENYTGFLLDPVHGDRRQQLQSAWSFGVRAVHHLELSHELSLESGLGLRGDALEQEQRHVDREEAPLDTERQLAAVQALYHGLLGLRWRPTPALRIGAGARLDLAHSAVRDDLDAAGGSSESLAALSPRATLEWRAGTHLRLFAAYGRGFRPPEARAFSSFEPEQTGVARDVNAGGDPALTVADAFEIGTRWAPSRYLRGSLSGFATLIERESVVDHVSGLNVELNGTRRLGTELVLRSSPLDGLLLSADVTYVDARFVESQRRVPLAPWLAGGFRASFVHESRWRAGLRFAGLAPRPLPNGARGAPLGVLDATAGYSWRGWRLDLELENIIDQRLREGEYHYASHWRSGEAPSQLPVVHHVAGPPFNARLRVSAIF